MKLSKPAPDYQEVLRILSHSMVRLKKPERLLGMVTRYLEKDLGISHASILVFKEDRRQYVFVNSRGKGRIPARLVRFDPDHALIAWFTTSRNRAGAPRDFVSLSELEKVIDSPSGFAGLGEQLFECMKTLRLQLAVPAYFKKQLMGMLLLGNPAEARRFTPDEISFFQIMAQECAMAVKTSELHKKILDKNAELENQINELQSLRDKEQRTHYEIMRSFAAQVYAKDAYTFGHIGQVERLGVMTAKEMGLDIQGRKGAILSAGLILHDLGKIGIPDHILNKPGKLSPDEWEIMKTHSEKGARILEPLSEFKEVREIVYSHHENYDGTGYPRGLQGDQIPIEARIVSVVDAFHAIVSTRCYSKGRPIETAFGELRRCSGKQFDGTVVEAFICAMDKEIRKRRPVNADALIS